MTKSPKPKPGKNTTPSRDDIVATSVRMPQRLRDQLDAWVRRRPELALTRSKAIRLILERALAKPAAFSLDEQIAEQERKLAREIPKERSPARGVAVMRKGLAEVEHRKLTARKKAK